MTFNTPGPSFPHVFSGNPEVEAEFHIEPLNKKDEFFLNNREDEDGKLITVERDKRDTGRALRAGHLGPPEQLKKENAMPRRYPESTRILTTGAPSRYHA
ncbi:MAG: hypothetical protein LC633_01540 [Desulfobulbaceae bacterium]|nr:hypothetical protein [Desulfobulbaceae bacterium]